MNRNLLLVAGLGAAVGGPIAVSSTGMMSSSESRPAATRHNDLEMTAESAAGGSASAPVIAGRARASLTGPRVDHFGQIIRFDATPEWIATHWSRVTTVAADHRYTPFRVAVLTGSRVDDLAGSLTYYFDAHRRVQRITFEGETGDARRLILLATQHFGMQAEPALDGAVYLKRWNGEPRSALRIRHAPVLRGDSPHSRLKVMLEVNRPGVEYGLSQRFRNLLIAERKLRR